jgi:hypothetical protein
MGFKESYIGYRFHLDVADSQIPVSCILTLASTHESQVVLLLAAMMSTIQTGILNGI